jgi:hypothetical protein
VLWRTREREVVIPAAYALGALVLIGQAAVHIQQYVSLFHGVRWIGPLFLGDAVVAIAAAAGVGVARLRRSAALAGIVVSTGALGGLVVSYGRGLFGWQEGGFRMPVAFAVGTEMAAVILLAVALASPSER